LLSKHASKLICLVLVCDKITLLRGYIYILTNSPWHLNRKCFAFRCILKILHLSRKRRNITRIVYNAWKNVNTTPVRIYSRWFLYIEGSASSVCPPPRRRLLSATIASDVSRTSRTALLNRRLGLPCVFATSTEPFVTRSPGKPCSARTLS